jgi:hypothetical protein
VWGEVGFPSEVDKNKWIRDCGIAKWHEALRRSNLPDDDLRNHWIVSKTRRIDSDLSSRALRGQMLGLFLGEFKATDQSVIDLSIVPRNLIRVDWQRGPVIISQVK